MRATDLFIRRPVLAVGERRDLTPHGGLNNNVNLLPAMYRSVRITGTTRDAHGQQHQVDDAIRNLAAWRKGLAESHERFEQEIPQRRMAEAFSEGMNKPVQRLEHALMEIGSEMERMRLTLSPPENSRSAEDSAPSSEPAQPQREDWSDDD